MLKIDSDWIVQNMLEFPWECLVGSTIIRNDDRVMVVQSVELRDWRNGPLISAQYLDDPEKKTYKCNIHGFENGILREIQLTQYHLQPIRDLMNRLEAERREIERKENEHSEQLRIEAERTKETAAFLNASRKFDLLLFDLDDTLLKSAHMEEFRGRENVGNESQDYIRKLKKESRELEILIPEEILLRIRDSFPDLKCGVFTRAPKSYAEILLAQCYPKIRWDCTIAYEDVEGKTKPKPDGIFAAAKRVGVRDTNRIALVGDEKSDIIAAYQANAYSILSSCGWEEHWERKRNPKRSDHYRAIDLLPDAKMDNPEKLIEIITQAEKQLPTLESFDAMYGHRNLTPRPRIETIRHFYRSQPEDQPTWVVVSVMGRYFAKSNTNSPFDFSRKHRDHPLTRTILQSKNGDDYPGSWIKCCASFFSMIAQTIEPSGQNMVVCPVPARPDQPIRLEKLLSQVSKELRYEDGLIFNNKVLSFKKGVVANKTLNQDKRFKNIREHLFVADQISVKNNNVLVVDDVTTSGATFFYAYRYLEIAGAKNIRCLALAQTIS